MLNKEAQREFDLVMGQRNRKGRHRLGSLVVKVLDSRLKGSGFESRYRAMANPFDKLLSYKLKGSTNKPATKRKRCHFKTKRVTDKTYVAELKRLEKAAEEKKASKGKKGMKKKKAEKQIEFEMGIWENAGIENEENEVGVDDNEEEEENS